MAPPSEIMAFCTHIVWRNSPQVACQDILAYHVRFISPNTDLTRTVDAHGTFYNLLLEEEFLKTEFTNFQVHTGGHAYILHKASGQSS